MNRVRARPCRRSSSPRSTFPFLTKASVLPYLSRGSSLQGRIRTRLSRSTFSWKSVASSQNGSPRSGASTPSRRTFSPPFITIVSPSITFSTAIASSSAPLVGASIRSHARRGAWASILAARTPKAMPRTIPVRKRPLRLLLRPIFVRRTLSADQPKGPLTPEPFALSPLNVPRTSCFRRPCPPASAHPGT